MPEVIKKLKNNVLVWIAAGSLVGISGTWTVMDKDAPAPFVGNPVMAEEIKEGIKKQIEASEDGWNCPMCYTHFVE